MKDNTILQLCAALLVCIFIVLVVQAYNPRQETVGEKIDEAVEEVKDEIDDHTTSK